jgi:TRAP-type mannitol/chloroaromatic compound transport system permease small subunit
MDNKGGKTNDGKKKAVSAQQSFIENVIGKISFGANVISAALILLLMLIIIVDVSGRYFFNYPILGSVELCRTLLVAIVFLSLGYAQRFGQHIRVDIVIVRASPILQFILEVIGLLGILAVFGIIFFMTLPVTIDSILKGEFETGAIPFPIWPSRLLLSVGLFIYILQAMAGLKGISRTSRHKFNHKEIAET